MPNFTGSISDKDDSIQAGLYKAYTNDNSYGYVSGVTVLPLACASPVANAQGYTPDPTPPVVVRLHQPYTVRKQKWAAHKEQTPPVIPGWTKDDTLLTSTVSVPIPQLGATGVPSFNWTVAGEYTYLSTKMWTEKSGYPVGLYPMSFPGVGAMQRDAFGAILGAIPTTVTALGQLNVDIKGGQYTWITASCLPAAFFDPVLSRSL